MSRSRIASIETFRVIAIFAVICIHATPFVTMEGYELFGYAILSACRFAVPFFLITSGYFFGVALRKGAPLLPLLGRYLKRLLVVFLGWSVIYGVLPDGILKTVLKGGVGAGGSAIHAQAMKTFTYITTYPYKFLLGGTKFHLWFFVALMTGLVILGVVLWFKEQKYLLPFSAVLFVAGFLMLHQTSFHVKMPWNFLGGNGPFYSPLLVSLGWWLAGRKQPPALWAAATLIVTGFLMLMAETFVFWDSFGKVPFLRAPYTLGALLSGAGVFLLTLARRQLGASTLLPKLGVLTLGIYASHILIQSNLPYGMMTQALGPIAATILRPFVIFLFGAVLTWLLRRFRPTRFLLA